MNGYEGYEYRPSFSENAKSILRGENGKEEFAKYFGDYYVKGCVKGASMKLVIRTMSTSTSSSQTIDISIKAGWNGGLMSIGGGGGFSQALSSSSTYSLDFFEIYYSGQDRGTGIIGLSIS